MSLPNVVPLVLRPDEPPQLHLQRPARPGVPENLLLMRPPFFWGTDDSWRVTTLPHQRRYDYGRLGNARPDHLAPTGSGGYVAVLGAGIGRPARLSTVPVFQYGLDGQLMRAGRVATGDPSQWRTLAPQTTGVIYERAEPVRWPTA